MFYSPEGVFFKSVSRLAGAVQLYANLGGVNVQSVEGDSVVLEIPNDAKPEDQATDQADTPLILTIKFRLDGGIRPVFAGAKVRKFGIVCITNITPNLL